MSKTFAANQASCVAEGHIWPQATQEAGGSGGRVSSVDDEPKEPPVIVAAIGGAAKLAGLVLIGVGALISLWLIGSLVVDWISEIF